MLAARQDRSVRADDTDFITDQFARFAGPRKIMERKANLARGRAHPYAAQYRPVLGSEQKTAG